MSREKPNREWMRGRNGITSNAWKGERAGYHATHLWLTKNYSKGDSCTKCGKVTPWLDWANISGTYKREREDYLVLCRSCHRLMDIGNKCRQGHEFTQSNTRVNSNGHRVCRKCQAVNQRKYIERRKYATAN